jgi:hypothetical protein
MKTDMLCDVLVIIFLLQVVTILSALSVVIQTVPTYAIEESYGHVAVAPIALQHAPALEISHAPIAIAHAPVVKEVEHVVSVRCLQFRARE